MSECRWDGEAYVPSGTKIRAEITQPSKGKKKSMWNQAQSSGLVKKEQVFLDSWIPGRAPLSLLWRGCN